jgi:hypothetical protein
MSLVVLFWLIRQVTSIWSVLCGHWFVGQASAPTLVLFRLRFFHEEQIRDSHDPTALLRLYGMFLRLNLRAVGLGVKE